MASESVPDNWKWLMWFREEVETWLLITDREVLPVSRVRSLRR